MKNALDYFWPLLEFVEPVMAIWSQWAWRSGVWEQLIEADFLCRTVNAETVLCPGCYQHDEEVIALDRPGGGVDLFVPCPESLRAQVDPEWLHQWTGNYAAMLAHDEPLRLQIIHAARERLVTDLANPQRIWAAWQRLFDSVSTETRNDHGCHHDLAQSPPPCELLRADTPQSAAEPVGHGA